MKSGQTLPSCPLTGKRIVSAIGEGRDSGVCVPKASRCIHFSGRKLGSCLAVESRRQISRWVSILLLVGYCAYLYFQLKTHIFLFQAEEAEEEEPVPQSWCIQKRLITMCLQLIFNENFKGSL